MAQGCIYVDDAGNPGQDSGSEFLSASRKSWTAVIVPSSVAGDIEATMHIFLTGVKSEFGTSELHFTDIYSGRGAWVDVEVSKRIEVFDVMKGILDSFSLQLCTKQSAKKH